MIMNCIYHEIDLDGWCSAAIVKQKFPDCNLIPYNYNEKKIPEIPPGDLIVVDVKLPMEVFKKLWKEGRRITWIDHHISAMREFDNSLRYDVMDSPTFITRLDPKKAACELTWDFINPGLRRPEAVFLLGRYDCFGHRGTPDETRVKLFQYGARARWTDPETTANALTCTREEVLEIIADGLIIYKSLLIDAKRTYSYGFPIEIDGWDFIAINSDRLNPDNFEIDYHADGYDGVACFHYANGVWNFSLYNANEKVDCSVLCQKRGGGGHRGAAGFTTKNIDEYVK